ncbi:MAG: carbohydrate kinase family protein [Jatrophihabitans sp.]|jgi:adenosine kinase|nr:carbohydrate kinase family protein [Jatrophihabitans sp.]MCW2657841.1 carbohydrate kinase family protein [Jatrophihabitans sp.]MDT4902896.1 adenosine kinase [Pseudonocardiales bacterium]MDT4927330.1 adenosine kinase [Pseudonocardiales bacterium]
MPTLVAGSIATDHLMHFPGKFSDQLLAEHLHKVSLSFLVDELVVRRGGVAPNICYGIAQLGGSPVLIGAVGQDFDDYRSFLEEHGVDCGHVHVSKTQHTARFVCTTDEEMCQIGSFYAGAMGEAIDIEIAPIWKATGADLVVISAYDPAAMVKHSTECREQGFRFVADPSQQITRMDGPALRAVIEGAELLFTNDYEKSLLESKTELSEAEIMARVDVRVTTLGSKGVEIVGRELDRVHVPAAKERAKHDPTGVGDAFRGGFLTARDWGLSWERAAQVGSLLATMVLETVGTQEYAVAKDDFSSRLSESYGDDCAADVLPHLV